VFIGRSTTGQVLGLERSQASGGQRANVNSTSLELTAAGNRLSNLARRGYVFPLALSRREGDEYVSLATFRDSPDAGPEGDASR
jgi:hypothetical protein